MSVVESCSHRAALLALFLTPACRERVDVEVDYQSCVPVSASPYVEEFRYDFRELADRCWQRDNDENTTILSDAGDLVIRPEGEAAWQGESQGPMAYLRLQGDFLAVARVEALSQIKGDHCIAPTELAGLVARRSEPEPAWAALLIGPVPTTPENCVEDSQNPPRARAELRRFGLRADSGASGAFPDELGEDGEADIAVCRAGSALAYAYRDVDAAEPNRWVFVDGTDAFGEGAVDVGLTTSGVEPGVIEGQFNWFVSRDITGFGDSCSGALEELVVPEGD
jgi:hypothetical protein